MTDRDALVTARGKLADMESVAYEEAFGPPNDPLPWIVAAREAVEWRIKLSKAADGGLDD